MDALYVKTSAGLEQIKLGGGSSASISIARQTTTLDADLPAGTPVAAPTHAVGTAKLQVFLDGVLCIPGEQYTDATANSVKFLDAIPAGHQITTVAFTGAPDPSDGTASYTAALAEKAQALEVEE